MEARTTARQRNTHPINYYWNVVKDMDNSQKLELMAMLIDSVQATLTPPQMKRYTMDEINTMLDEAEADFAAVKGIPDEEVWRKWDEELAREEQEVLDYSRLPSQELEMAEKV